MGVTQHWHKTCAYTRSRSVVLDLDFEITFSRKNNIYWRNEERQRNVLIPKLKADAFYSRL